MSRIGGTRIGSVFSGGPVSIPILLPDGSAAAPSLAFTSDADVGIYQDDVISVGIGIAGAIRYSFRIGQLLLRHEQAAIVWGTSHDLILIRDAANTLALKNVNAEQQFNIYSGNGAYGLIKSVQELVTTTAAATAVTAATFIPDGAIPLAISTYIETAISGAGVTGYSVGDGADIDRWGAVAGIIAGTHTANDDWTATTIQAFIAAQAITLTATGANFAAGGKIRVTMTYITGTQATS